MCIPPPVPVGKGKGVEQGQYLRRVWEYPQGVLEYGIDALIGAERSAV